MSAALRSHRTSKGNPGRREARTILIRVGLVALRARVLSGPTAEWIWSALPIYSSAERAGGILHFATHAACDVAVGASDVVRVGDIGFSPEQRRIVIAWHAGVILPVRSIRLPLPCSVWATALDDVALLGNVQPGERVAVLLGES